MSLTCLAQRRTRNSQYCHLRHYYSTESTSKYDQKETAAPPPSSSNGIARVQDCGGPGGVTDQPAVIPCGLSGSLVPGYHWDWQLDKKVSINLLLHLRYGHSRKGASGWVDSRSLLAPQSIENPLCPPQEWERQNLHSSLSPLLPCSLSILLSEAFIAITV